MCPEGAFLQFRVRARFLVRLHLNSNIFLADAAGKRLPDDKIYSSLQRNTRNNVTAALPKDEICNLPNMTHLFCWRGFSFLGVAPCCGYYSLFRWMWDCFQCFECFQREPPASCVIATASKCLFVFFLLYFSPSYLNLHINCYQKCSS